MHDLEGQLSGPQSSLSSGFLGRCLIRLGAQVASQHSVSYCHHLLWDCPPHFHSKDPSGSLSDGLPSPLLPIPSPESILNVS